MLLLKSAKNVTRYVGIISQADGKLHAEAFGTSLQASGTLQYMAKLSGSQKTAPTSSLHREKKVSEAACFWSFSGCLDLMREFL